VTYVFEQLDDPVIGEHPGSAKLEKDKPAAWIAT
jgi:hypothetical protein